MNNNRTRCLSHLVGTWLVLSWAVAGAAETPPTPTITGAGEHFTWVLLDQIRPQLERDHRLQLSLFGKDSMLGHGCNVGIKKARENRVGNETFGFICCPLAKEEVEKEGLTVHPIALEPLLIIVNKSNPLQDIPIEKVRAIFRVKYATGRKSAVKTGQLWLCCARIVRSARATGKQLCRRWSSFAKTASK